MKELISASKKVLSRPWYPLIGVVAGLLLLLAAIWLPNLSFIGSTLTSGYLSFGEKFGILASSLSALDTNFTPLSRTLTVTLAVLFAVDAAFLAFYLRTRFRLERSAGIGIGGIILGLLGVGCASCGTVVASAFLGAGATAGFLDILPLKGQEFGFLGVGFMAFGILLTARKIEQPLACDADDAAMLSDDRHGAKQHERFNPSHATGLDDASRFAYVPPDDVIAALDIPHGGTIIDFGTGTGTYAIAIAQRRPDAAVVAFDEQSAMLERMRAKPESKMLGNIAIVSGGGIGNYKNAADRILALNVLHELGDAALHELKDLLSANGEALFIDWNAEVDRPVGPPADHVYSPKEAAARLTDAGFEVREVKGGKGFPYHYSIAARPGA